jgi:hypothetical protein
MAENSAPELTEVAGLIAPTNAPAWLTTLLRDWVPSIMLDRGVHMVQPTKAEMRDQLTQMADAAAILQRGLSNVSTKEFLELEGGVHIENFGGLDHTLRVVGERAALSAASPRIAAAGKAKKGRGRALPSGAISPKAFCALIVAETWAHLRGDQPAPRNQEAAAAADAYWRASGGTTQSWGSDPLTSWSYHFKEAQSPAAETLRKEVRRHCVEHSHFNQLLSASENN